MADQPPPPPPSRGGRVSDDDIERARFNVTRAFQLLSLVGAGGRPVCPDCGTDRRGKVALKDTKGYWKCHRCGEYGSPIRLLTDHGWHFVDAVNALLGREVSADAPAPPARELKPIAASADFTATVDPEVYTWIARHGDRDAAARYYAQWHIAAHAVREAGGYYLPFKRSQLTALHATAVETFGRERLIAAGVAMELDPAKVRPARTATEAAVEGLYFPGLPPGYPVGEPHVTADGQVTYSQFRPDGRFKDEVDAHKAAKKAKQRAEARGQAYTGTVPPYKPPYLSYRGMPHEAMCGGGVWRLARLEPNSVVVIVEGIKDLLAARTMGAEAYALPGAQTSPPDSVLELLSRHRVAVALDGDDDGEQGRQRITELLVEAGVNAAPKPMPAGMDVTDILIDRHAAAGCTCPVCTTWRAEQAA